MPSGNQSVLDCGILPTWNQDVLVWRVVSTGNRSLSD